MPAVLRFLQNFSAGCFYLLGLSYALGFVLLKNEIGAPWPSWWMSVADIPFAAVTLLFGGSSLFLSLKKGEDRSWILGSAVLLPLLLFFGFLVVLNFWEMFF